MSHWRQIRKEMLKAIAQKMVIHHRAKATMPYPYLYNVVMLVSHPAMSKKKASRVVKRCSRK